MIQSLPYDEIKFDKNVKLQDFLNTEDNSVIGYTLEVDIKCPDEIKENKKHFRFCPKIEGIPEDEFSG